MVRTLAFLLLVASVTALAGDPATYDPRFAVVATDSSGYGGPLMPMQGPSFFDQIRTAWWYNYTPRIESYQVPGLMLFWPGYQRLYMFWRASGDSDAAIQNYASAAKAADPTRTIWWAMSNEPNDRGQANQTATSFAPIYLKYHKNLRIGDPTCKIMGCGLLDWRFTNSSCYQTGKSWYQEFRNAWAANPDCVAYSQSVNGTTYPPQDAFSLHSYDIRWPGYWRWCRDELMACYADLQTYPETQGLKVWNTEWGDLTAPTQAQAADIESGLALWMREQPWMEKWFLFYTHDDRYSGFGVLNLFDDAGNATQLGRVYRDLSLLPADEAFYHFPYSATWDTAADYVRPMWSKSNNVGESLNNPGCKFYLTNGIAYSANTMRGRKFAPDAGSIWKVRFNYLTNYDNSKCVFAMDTSAQTAKWQVDAFGVSTDYVEIDLSANPVNWVAFGLYIKTGFTYAYTTGDWRGLVANLMLFTCPSAPAVTDEGSVCVNPNHLGATWTVPAGGKQPIVEYEYCIGTSPKGSEVLAWTSAGASLSFSRDDLNLVDGVTYYVSVRAKDSHDHWGGAGCSDGITKVRRVATVGGAKREQAGAYFGLEDLVVSAVFSEGVYVQQADRSAGIKVLGISGVQTGDVVTVAGTIALDGHEAVLGGATLVKSAPGIPPLPLGVTSRSVGGGPFGLQPGTPDTAP